MHSTDGNYVQKEGSHEHLQRKLSSLDISARMFGGRRLLKDDRMLKCYTIHPHVSAFRISFGLQKQGATLPSLSLWRQQHFSLCLRYAI